MHPNHLNELPVDIQLQLSAEHGFSLEELSNQESSTLKISYCNGIMQSLFRVLKYVTDNEQKKDEINFDEDIIHLSELGLAVAQAQSKEIERLDDYLTGQEFPKQPEDSREN